MIWASINIVSALVVSAIIVYKLAAYPDSFNFAERLGMGMIGSGMLLRIGPILGNNVFDTTTPFDFWSVTVLHVGLTIYFVGRFLRYERITA